MKKIFKSINEVIEQRQAEINTNFLKEWTPFDQINKKVERAIVRHFMRKKYMFQSGHDASSKRPFNVCTLAQIETVLGLPYTSSSKFAGLWVTNSGYLWATDTHYFIGFAVNELGEVIGIAHDTDENEYFVKL